MPYIFCSKKRTAPINPAVVMLVSSISSKDLILVKLIMMENGNTINIQTISVMIIPSFLASMASMFQLHRL